MRRIVLLALLTAAGCASYRPAPLSVNVVSVPDGADVELSCSNQQVRRGITPARFRVPQYAVPCALVLTKAGFKNERREIGLDSIRRSASPPQPPQPIHFDETATPFSLLGALIVRSLDNLGARVAERVATALVPDVEIHVELEPE